VPQQGDPSKDQAAYNKAGAAIVIYGYSGWQLFFARLAKFLQKSACCLTALIQIQFTSSDL
jgi:hypothetical protein